MYGKVKTTRLSATQLQTMRLIRDGKVEITYGTVTTKNCTIHTVWSLEERGVIRGPNGEVGRPRLTPFGLQILGE